MKAVVWTQPGCSYCTKVKQILTEAGYEIEEKDIGPKGSAEREEFKTFIGSTTPQVFIDDVQIGTYEDTVAWLKARDREIANVEDTRIRNAEARGDFRHSPLYT